MTGPSLVNRDARPEEDTLVIAKLQDGYRVYSVHQPSRSYMVRSDHGRWTCNCQDIATRTNDPARRCRHILAVAPWPAHAAENGAAEPNGTAAAPPNLSAMNGAANPPPGALMLIRRSVSPDGRIDSVSVEITIPVAGDTSGAIKDKALRTLGLQKEIVAHFLGGSGANGNGHAVPAPQPNGDTQNGGYHPNGSTQNGDEPVSARILEIGEVKGKWGPRLCLSVQVNGNRTRLFGSAKQLAEKLADAGYDYNPAALRSGLRLNLDCRVTTLPSEDGKYLNIEAVFPARPNGGAR